jgi:hypothetical protein
MAAKKRPVRHEPLLNTVARKLGHAAGTVTKVTQELTENLSTLPANVAAKVSNATNTGTRGKRSRIRTGRPGKSVRRAVRRQRTKVSATVEKRRSSKNKSPRSRKPIKIKG